jgi:hypothetical protein
MNQNITSDEKWIFEVRNGVILIFGERTEFADGWWFSTNAESFGPFSTDQKAIDAAAVASDATASLNIIENPSPPLPVTDARRSLTEKPHDHMKRLLSQLDREV